MNADLKTLIHAQPTSEAKFIPEIFFSEGASVIRRLLDGLILGDGCTSIQEGRQDRIGFYTKSHRLAGDVQALALMVGERASVRQRPSGLYAVGFNRKGWAGVDDAKFDIVPYRDFAFCVTVDNHSIYVRRNGVAAFTGNSNYREKLLTMPTPPMTELPPGYRVVPRSEVPRMHYTGQPYTVMGPAQGGGRGEGSFGSGRTPEEAIAQSAEHLGPETYTSSHWDEPNVLVHRRTNEREVNGKPSLHVEEIQSDWHQKPFQQRQAEIKRIAAERGISKEDAAKEVAQNYGYKDPTVENKLNENYQKTETAKKALWDKSAGIDEIESVLKPLQDERAALLANATHAVPDAPFKKNWHELALKDAIREAAEKGIDRISWTPGEAQAARYDLSKQVKEIRYNPDNEWLHVSDIRGNKIDTPARVPPEKLPDIIGKEAAERLINSERRPYLPGSNSTEHVLSGDGLKMGGDGMKGFYDKMIPDALNKIGKPHGVKVEGGTTGGKQYGIREQPITGEVGGPRNVYDVMDPGGYLNSSFHTRAEAQAHIDAKTAKEKTPVHYMDIPPSLKEQALKKGFSLFEDSSVGAPMAALEKKKQRERGGYVRLGGALKTAYALKRASQ